MKVRANEKGHLYEHVTAAKIANEIFKKYQCEIGEGAVFLKEPIREARTQPIEIRLGEYHVMTIVEVKSFSK